MGFARAAGRRWSVTVLSMTPIVLAGCVLPPVDEEEPPEQSAQVHGAVVRVSDVVGQEPEPEPGGEVWFVPVTEAGYDGPEPDEAAAAARLRITDGSYRGAVPVGEWRPCIRQEGGRAFCSIGTIVVPDGGIRIDLDSGDGFIGFDVG